VDRRRRRSPSFSCPSSYIFGRFVARDIINEETGEIWVEAGDELTWELDKDGEVKGGTLKLLMDQGITELPVLDIDGVNVGPYIRNTHGRRQEHEPRTGALMDIYRVMRPGEPPTYDAAAALFRYAVLRFRSATTSPPLAA
jgi:DNA-directed RNA polymerase subunit beta